MNLPLSEKEKNTSSAQRLGNAEISDGLVTITWTDQSLSRFHFIWLRDNCRCSECGEPSIGRRTLRLTAIDLDITPRHIEIQPDDILSIEWSDGHQSQFDGSWLRTHRYDEASRKQRGFQPVLWTPDIRNHPPSMDFTTVMENDDGFLKMLHHVRDLGICFLKDAPAVPGTLEKLSEKIGFIQENNFGRVQDLVVDESKRSIANDVHALKPHTDEPYRASPPGILLFHCVETDITGAGSSTFLDAFEAAEVLRREDPEGFDALCHYRQPFRRHFADDVDLIAEFPVISVNEFGEVTGVRVNDRVAAPLSIPEEQVPVYYRGLKRFLELTEDPDRMLLLTLRPGDIAIFDNHRVLHGRTRLTMKGRRWLQWIQVERGDFHSTMRIVADRLNVDRDALPLLRGAYS